MNINVRKEGEMMMKGVMDVLLDIEQYDEGSLHRVLLKQSMYTKETRRIDSIEREVYTIEGATSEEHYHIIIHVKEETVLSFELYRKTEESQMNQKLTSTQGGIYTLDVLGQTYKGQLEDLEMYRTLTKNAGKFTIFYRQYMGDSASRLRIILRYKN